MIGSNSARSGSSSDSPAAGAQLGLLRRQHRCHPVGVVGDVGRLAGGEDGLDLLGGQRMAAANSVVVPVKSAVDPGIISRPRSWPLVRIWSRNTIWSGKMLAGSPWSSLRSRSSGSRKHGGPADGTTQVAPDLGDVLAGAVHLALPLLGAERLLGARRHVVDHRVPDRAGVLQQVHVDVTELVRQHVQIDRPGVVHVESRCRAVGNHQRRIADRAVGGCAQRDDHDVELALRAR